MWSNATLYDVFMGMSAGWYCPRCSGPDALQYGVGAVRVWTDELSRNLPIVQNPAFLAVIERPGMQCLAVQKRCEALVNIQLCRYVSEQLQGYPEIVDYGDVYCVSAWRSQEDRACTHRARGCLDEPRTAVCEAQTWRGRRRARRCMPRAAERAKENPP